ncbi:hypothetical protein RHGRI_009624 [Rhododendron griersonianum]|uniref:Proton pump-interactor 1 n=1 Tax=Rhododendron griersonianum TaxID=479676 RepID=A0AAV6KFP5_9ERIC|nr:hypothetical protein RHGRI_009624 [Rhododendron griersonianum]
MDLEVVKSDLAQLSMESACEENGKMHQGICPSEPIIFGSHDVDEPVNIKGISASVPDVPKDVVDEWPEAQKIHSFFFVKYRSYEDPKLKAQLEYADSDLRKKDQARSQLIEKWRAKKSAKFELDEQIRPLRTENDQYWTIMGEKRKEMEPLQHALGKLRNPNSVNREKGVGLCSSEDELNYVIKSLHYRIQHESIPLSEEKQLLRDIKQLEGTREKVIANDAMRVKIQDSLGEKDVIQGQVKLMGVNLDGVRKDMQAVKDKIKTLVQERDIIKNEITKLDAEVTAATESRDAAYKKLWELRNQRDKGVCSFSFHSNHNSCYYQNREFLYEVKGLAAKKDIGALMEKEKKEVEEFMSQWNGSKDFRDDYERRILPSLDMRQLSRDGRIRNPDEKPLVVQEARNLYENVTVTKTNIKRPTKEDSISSPVAVPVVEEVTKEAKSKPQKEAKNNKPISSGKPMEPIELEDKGEFYVSEKVQKDLPPKANEVVDEAKLKEMKREEEIAKAKLALERKKKLAEKAAAKAAIKAQKEAEKKLKAILHFYPPFFR